MVQPTRKTPPTRQSQAPVAAVPPPPDRLKGRIEDRRDHFAALTRRTPIDRAARAAFIAGKLNLAHTHYAFAVVS
jgi:hypothetical protein